MRRLEGPAAASLFQRIQRSPLRNLDPRFTPEADVARLEKEHPELVAADEKGAIVLKPWGDWLWLVYGFADRDALRQRFPPLLERLLKGLDVARLSGGQARWPDGVRARFTDHPNRPFVEPVLMGCAFEVHDEWMEMDLLELPESGPPSPNVAPGYVLRPITEEDLPEYIELDREAFGAPRPMSLEALGAGGGWDSSSARLGKPLELALSQPAALRRPGAIDDIAVRPDLQRRGLGEAMMPGRCLIRRGGMRRACRRFWTTPPPSPVQKLGFAGRPHLSPPLDEEEMACSGGAAGHLHQVRRLAVGVTVERRPSLKQRSLKRIPTGTGRLRCPVRRSVPQRETTGGTCSGSARRRREKCRASDYLYALQMATWPSSTSS
jgi:hypothetical protein